jgi:hypothetical protein
MAASFMKNSSNPPSSRETPSALITPSVPIFESYPVDARLYAFYLSSGGPADVHRRSGAAGSWDGRGSLSKSHGLRTVLSYGVLYMGSHNLNCWVHLNGQSEEHEAIGQSRARGLSIVLISLRSSG